MVVEIDPFDSLLSIEEELYEEGYQQGYQDGLRQSQFEAQLFGIEKGFEKFIVMGKLQAKAAIWAARISVNDAMSKTQLEEQSNDRKSTESQDSKRSIQLPPLPQNPRLEKHIQTLLALVDDSTLSTANSDDAVAEFDDRLKRAQAKEKVIEKIIGEAMSNSVAQNQSSNTANRNTSDFENFGLK